MDKTRLYHGLFTLFGGFVLAMGVAQLLGSLSIAGVLFVVAGIGMVLTSGLALVRPEAVSTEEPATWKLVAVALGIVLFVVGAAVQYL